MSWQLALIASDMSWPEALVTVAPIVCVTIMVVAFFGGLGRPK